MSNMNEYSGTDTLDRRITNTYLNQYNYANNMPMPNQVLNSSMNNNNLNSVGYSTSKDLNLIRTNLNNMDYNSTMYRRPQLHPSIYERSMPIQEGSNGTGQVVNGQANNTNQYAKRIPSASNNASILSNSSMHGLPPPPPPIMFDPDSINKHNASNLDHIENEIFGPDFDRGLGGDDEDDIIPNWVPIDRCIEKVITTYDYEGLREDELSFKENMYIYVIKKNDDHWYEGIMKNENGDIIQGNKKLK